MRRFAFAFALPVLLATTACQGGARTTSTAGARTAAPAPSPAPAPYAAPAPARACVPVAAPSAPAGAPRFDATNPTLDQALAAGRAAGKPVAVFLLANWCGFCRKLDAGALTDGSVHVEMANFYAVRIDPDTPNGRQFARLARGGYPTVAILDATGAEKANWAGNRPAADLAAKLPLRALIADDPVDRGDPARRPGRDVARGPLRPDAASVKTATPRAASRPQATRPKGGQGDAGYFSIR